MARPVALLAAGMISSVRVQGLLDTPGLRVDGVSAINFLIEQGGTDATADEAVDVAIDILQTAARRMKIPWLSDEDEHLTRLLLERAYNNYKDLRPEIFND